MQFRTSALVIALRSHGENAGVVRLFTPGHGVVAAYVAGARGRRLRPVLIPGNRVEAEISARSDSQLPFARIELTESRGPWLGEPLASAAIDWASALTAAALPERQPYPALYDVLGALLDAVCHAPSARGWAGALVGYETLLLREMGYDDDLPRPPSGELPATLAALDRLGPRIAAYALADRRADVMAARAILLERLARMA